MKLIYRILRRLSAALLVLMAGWAVAFYFILTDEINDETDDALESYAHDLITRVLAGEYLPSEDNGTNNTYYMEEVDTVYAAQNPAVHYTDEIVYIQSRMETEPARVLKTIFRDRDDRFFELTVAIPSFEKRDLQQRILWWILILYAALLAAVITTNAWIVRRSFKPLYALLEWMERAKPGMSVQPFAGETDITEFRRLNETVMRSVKRNNEMFDEQRLFTGNASHELQTPIAVCRARLEMLAADPSLGEEQIEQVASVLGTLDHLSRLNKTLLLLARIDNRGFPDSSDIDVCALLRKLAADYAEVYSHRNITAAEICEEDTLHISMDETLASVLFSNLLKNAFTHSPEGGLIAVAVTARSVSVSNSASGGPLDPHVIFRRFYRGDSRDGSNGLGLALAESVCRLYGFGIAYDFDKGRHIFTVTV